MIINFHHKYTNPKEARIVQFEKKIGVSLPKKYRGYLLAGNLGSTPDEDLCYKIGQPGVLDCMSEWDEALVDELCSIKEMEEAYMHMSSSLRDRAWLPDEMLIIGNGPCGSHLLICVAGNNVGKIYFWASNLFPVKDDMEPTYENICFVANDFDLFIKCLYVFDD